MSAACEVTTLLGVRLWFCWQYERHTVGVVVAATAPPAAAAVRCCLRRRCRRAAVGGGALTHRSMLLLLRVPGGAGGGVGGVGGGAGNNIGPEAGKILATAIQERELSGLTELGLGGECCL